MRDPIITGFHRVKAIEHALNLLVSRGFPITWLSIGPVRAPLMHINPPLNPKSAHFETCR